MSDDDWRNLIAQADREREADDLAEAGSAPLGDAARARLALQILGERRAWTAEARRALGLARAIDRVHHAEWLAAVDALTATLDATLVTTTWLDLAAGGHDPHPTRPQASAAMARAPTVAGFAESLRRLFEAPPDPRWRGTLRDALCAAVERRATDDEALRRLLAALILSPERPPALVEPALQVAGALARHSRAAAALLAARARIDRQLVAEDIRAGRSLTDSRAAGGSTLATAVATARRAELLPTIHIELERSSGHARWWAPALLATAGDDGARMILQRSHRLGWSLLVVDVAAAMGESGEGLRRALLDSPAPKVRLHAAKACRDRQARAGELAAVWASLETQGEWHSLLAARPPSPTAAPAPPSPTAAPALAPLPSPLEALTSPLADLRVDALDEVEAQPRPDHLLALLLGAQLERWLFQHRPEMAPHRFRGQPSWLPILHRLVRGLNATEELARGIELEQLFARAAQIAPGLDDEQRLFRNFFHGYYTTRLFARLLDAGIFSRTSPVPQRMTPELDELLALGPQAFTTRWPSPAHDRDALEAAELAFAGDAYNDSR